MTRAHISLILCFILMFLSFQMVFSLASAVIVSAVLESISFREPSIFAMTDNGTEVFEVKYCFQLLPLYRDVSL